MAGRRERHRGVGADLVDLPGHAGVQFSETLRQRLDGREGAAATARRIEAGKRIGRWRAGPSAARGGERDREHQRSATQPPTHQAGHWGRRLLDRVCYRGLRPVQTRTAPADGRLDPAAPPNGALEAAAAHPGRVRVARLPLRRDDRDGDDRAPGERERDRGFRRNSHGCVECAWRASPGARLLGQAPAGRTSTRLGTMGLRRAVPGEGYASTTTVPAILSCRV